MTFSDDVRTQALTAYVGGERVPIIAAELHVGMTAIYRWLADAGLNRRKSSAPTTPKGEHNSSRYSGPERCRCQVCRDAIAAYVAGRRHSRRLNLQMGLSTVQHGLVSTYENDGCRCIECSTVKSVQNSKADFMRRAINSAEGQP